MWCPLVPSTSAIFFLLPALRATGIKHNALCVRTAEEALCVFVLKALFHLSRTIRIEKQATSTVAKRTGAAISINYLPCRALASQGPCVEPSGQQSTPCRGSTTVQRPVLTGKKEGGGLVVKHFKPARPAALSHPTPPALAATQGRLRSDAQFRPMSSKLLHGFVKIDTWISLSCS